MRKIKTRRQHKSKTQRTKGKRAIKRTSTRKRHSVRKRRYSRKIRGGILIPRGVKNVLTKVGLRNITNIEKITDCNSINNVTTPRLFLVLQGIRNYNENMYNYYMPLDSDTPEVKQMKCDRLNALREEWIQKKNAELKNGRTDTAADRAIINKSLMGMSVDTTRYFQFLAENYCEVVENNPDKPQICNMYTASQLQKELYGQEETDEQEEIAGQ